MTRWGEIKCPRCAEQDALWEGMERALEESDAREARLERWLAESETREATLNDRITMLEEHLCLTEEKLSKCEALLAKAVEAMENINKAGLGFDTATYVETVSLIARTILAALKGQDDE